MYLFAITKQPKVFKQGEILVGPGIGELLPLGWV